MIQSARFSLRESPRSVNHGRGWTEGHAHRWLRAHGLRAPQPFRTPNQLRFRQADPSEFETFTTLTEDLPTGVQLLDAE